MFHNTVWVRPFYLSLSFYLSSLFSCFRRAGLLSVLVAHPLPWSRTASGNATVGSHETDEDSLFLSRSQEIDSNAALLCQVEMIGAEAECIQRVTVLQLPAILLSRVGKLFDVSCRPCCCPSK